MVEILNFYLVGYSSYLLSLSKVLGRSGVGRHREIPIQGLDTGWGLVGIYLENSHLGGGRDPLRTRRAPLKHTENILSHGKALVGAGLVLPRNSWDSVERH